MVWYGMGDAWTLAFIVRTIVINYLRCPKLLQTPSPAQGGVGMIKMTCSKQ